MKRGCLILRRCKYSYGCERKLFDFLKCKCRYYVPVKVDPYWKDIFDETNRRLSLKK